MIDGDADGVVDDDDAAADDGGDEGDAAAGGVDASGVDAKPGGSGADAIGSGWTTSLLATCLPVGGSGVERDPIVTAGESIGPSSPGKPSPIPLAGIADRSVVAGSSSGELGSNSSFARSINPRGGLGGGGGGRIDPLADGSGGGGDDVLAEPGSGGGGIDPPGRGDPNGDNGGGGVEVLAEAGCEPAPPFLRALAGSGGSLDEGSEGGPDTMPQGSKDWQFRPPSPFTRRARSGSRCRTAPRGARGRRP